MRRLPLAIVAACVLAAAPAAPHTRASSPPPAADAADEGALGGPADIPNGGSVADSSIPDPLAEEPGTSLVAPSLPTVSADEAQQWLLGYVGGAASPVSGPPVRIGFATDDASFPGWSAGAAAATEYVNEQLGGVGGRPIELVECAVTTTGEATDCASQFAEDESITVVLTGAFADGNLRFHRRLEGRRPVLVGAALTTADLGAAAAVSYSPGIGGVAAGAARFALDDLDARNVAVLVADDDVGDVVIETMMPILDAGGADSTVIFITAGTDDAAAVDEALTAAGAADADAVIALLPPTLCPALADSMVAAALTTAMVTGEFCLDVDAVAADWYVVGSGYSAATPDLDSGMAAIVEAWPGPNPPTPAQSSAFAEVLAVVRQLNGLDDDAEVDDVTRTLRGFDGPMLLQPGPLTCGLAPAPAVCAHVVGVGRVAADGSWLPVRSALTDNPIDVGPTS